MGSRRDGNNRWGSHLKTVWAFLFLALVLGVFSVQQAAAQAGVRRPTAPSLFGTEGLFRTISAEALPPGSLTLGLYGEFFKASGFTFPNTDTQRLAADLVGSWAPYSFKAADLDWYMEAGLKWRASAVDFSPDATTALLFPSLGSGLIEVSALDLYLKTVHTQVEDDKRELYSYGLGLGVFVPAEIDSIGFDFGQTSLRFDGLFTVDFAAHDELWAPVKLHANVGYFLSNVSKSKGFSGVTAEDIIRRFAFQESVYDQLRLRFGAEYVHRVFTPFIEWGMDGVLDLPTGVGFFDSPMWVTPGLRLRPTPEVNISVGVEIAMAQAANPNVSVLPDWNLIFGVAYVFVPLPPPPPPPLITPKESKVALVTTGKITGVVYDANTNLPIGEAVVAFPGRGLTSLLTDTESGGYTTYELPAGPVEIKVDRKGYLGRSASPVVVAGQTITQDFYLVPEVVEPEKGTFRGTVQSLDGQFLAGKVSLFGTDQSRNTDEGVGQFVFELGAGDYRATAESEGYLPETHAFTLAGGEVLIHDFVLKKKPVITKKKFVEVSEKRIEIKQNIFFTTGKATILEQSFPLLREVAAALNENTQILLVEIGGHTDTQGSAEYNKTLSERRANSVRQFLINEGVQAERLTAVGYGEEVPLVFPDDTNEKRARNRRVEFLILRRQ